MPLPWKKAKVARISRLVADLQSPKRGGSLVVETGFPTSLIDLFVKNRDRLKKPSKKKRFEVSDPMPPSNSTELPAFASTATVSVPKIDKIKNPVRRIGEELVGCDANEARDSVVDGDEEGVEMSATNTNGVFVAVLKMSLVVILALGTKKLAVGITMSAFLLLFLELVGKRVACFLIRRVLPFVRSKASNNLIEEEAEIVVSDYSGSNWCLESNAFDEEIQIVDPKFDLAVAPIEGAKNGKPNCDLLSRDKRWGCEEMDAKKRVMERDENGGEVLELRTRRSRSAKMKAKIKKFVPKKFRSLKTGKSHKERESDSSGELSSYIGEDKLSKCEEQEQEEDVEEEVRDEDKLSQSSSDEGRYYEEEDVDEAIRSSGELSRAVVREKVGGERKRSSGYLVLFLIVLVGLIGGRILALALAVVWCLMLKLVGTLRRFKNVFMSRSSVEISS